jgi:hypothetical protein
LEPVIPVATEPPDPILAVDMNWKFSGPPALDLEPSAEIAVTSPPGSSDATPICHTTHSCEKDLLFRLHIRPRIYRLGACEGVDRELEVEFHVVKRQRRRKARRRLCQETPGQETLASDLFSVAVTPAVASYLAEIDQPERMTPGFRESSWACRTSPRGPVLR